MAIGPRWAGTRRSLTRAASNPRALGEAEANPQALGEAEANHPAPMALAANHPAPTAGTGRVAVVGDKVAAVVMVYNIFAGCKAAAAGGSMAVGNKAVDNRAGGSMAAGSKAEDSMAALA